MKSRRPAMRVRALVAAVVAMFLLALTAATASADPQPGPTTLTASVEMRADFLVTIVGTLADEAGTPVPSSTIFAQVNGDELVEGTTDDQGDYLIEFTVAESLRSETQPLVVFFEGRDGMEASQTDASVPAPPTETRIGSTLSATTASSSVSSGGLVIIDGTLEDEDGAPVSGVGIRVVLDDNESADSLVMTDEVGAFQTFAEVPSERPAGDASLVVSFAGDDNYVAAQQEIGLAVEKIPVADGNSPEASPSATDMPEASATVDPSMGATDEADSADAVKDGDRSPLSWFYVALVVVGGAALLITAGLVFRGIYGRSGQTDSRRAGSIDVLRELAVEDDEEQSGESSPASEGGISENADADAGSDEDTQPRHGIE